MSAASVASVTTKFGALHHRDYRRYFNIAFTSMAQALVQILAPPPLRGRVVGLFNTSMLGLRAGSGLTVGVLGSVIGVEWSLALSAGAVVAVAMGLLIADVRGRALLEPSPTPQANIQPRGD